MPRSTLHISTTGAVSIVEGDHRGTWLKWEEPNMLYSREQVTLVGGQYSSGEVVEENTSEGYLQRITTPKPTDGANDVYGILYSDVDCATSQNIDTVAVVREAIVVDANLTLPEDIEADHRAEVMDTLKQKGIISREEA